MSLLVRRLAAVVNKEYAWCYRATYSRRVTEQAHVAVSDPTSSTESTALGEQRAKRELFHIGHRIARAIDELRSAEYALSRVLDHFDPEERIEPTRYPRTESRQDLTEHAEAKERRESRGEGWGDA